MRRLLPTAETTPLPVCGLSCAVPGRYGNTTASARAIPRRLWHHSLSCKKLDSGRAIKQPIDRAKRGHFQIRHVAPRVLTVNQLGFVETICGLSEGIVLRVSDAADRRFDASFGQKLSVAVIPPFLMGFSRRIHAAVFSFMAGVMPPIPMLGRSLL